VRGWLGGHVRGRKRATYDLLLLDCELPGASGLELARRARSLAHRRRTPVIIMSGSQAEGAALRAGADVFLKKPEDTSAIVEIISRLLITAGASTRGPGV
jgi:two-component system, OmpR family, phosphate regulon response regulator PhoB